MDNNCKSYQVPTEISPRHVVDHGSVISRVFGTLLVSDEDTGLSLDYRAVGVTRTICMVLRQGKELELNPKDIIKNHLPKSAHNALPTAVHLHR